MNVQAELTLQIARLVQPRNQRRTPAGLMFWPDGFRVTWAEANAFLADAPKPVIVAPLVEPGLLGLWSQADISAARKDAFAAELANQRQYYEEKLHALGLGPQDLIHAEWTTPEQTVTVNDFLRWADDYVMPVPISLERSDESGAVRLIVSPPGGGAPPLGRRPSDVAPAS